MYWLRSVAILVAVVVGVWGMNLSIATASQSAVDAHLGLEKAKGGACAIGADTDVVRRTHMNILKHKRDLTVREGSRNPKDSLLNCKSCHTSREQFCDKCHDYVGVKPDCFACHYYP